MLNLWKKIQEKGRLNSPKKNVNVTALGPQYDGPLKSFDSDSSDVVPLEKCRLTLTNIHDIYENKSAYIFFKSFLESKMVLEVLLLYNSLICDDKQTLILDKEPDDDRSQSDVTENSHGSNAGSPTLYDFMSKLPEEIQTKLALANKPVDNTSNNLNMAVLKSVLHEVLLDYWNEFIHSEWYFRYQVDLLTSRSVTLGDIMCHDTALSYFMQFLEMEGCSNVIEFWLATTNFKQFVQNCIKNDQVDVNQILNDAINIYEKYLSLLATCPLGFNDNVRCAVEEAICDETNGPHAESFELAVNIVLAFLRKTYLIPFLSSQHYVHMLSDLIRNISTTFNHSPTSSVSEYSTDTKKAFLTKFDPDSMWRRRKRSGLSFGHVDQLGRFQSDIEPDPDRISAESKISKIMKKWVQRSANRVEEEMAWQVAEMVVKDITDLTLGTHLDNFESEDCSRKSK